MATTRLVLIIVAMVAAPLAGRLVSVIEPPPRKIPFDPRERLEIAEENPHFVFIGNSMLASRFQKNVLRDLIAPKRASFIAPNGSPSARWYLQLKNEVIASGVQPERVIIFFRDYEMTMPQRRVENGRFRDALERDSLEDEPVLRRVLDGHRGVRGRLAAAARRLVPIGHLQRAAQAPIDRFALGASSFFVPLGADSRRQDDGLRRRRQEVNAIFDIDHLRPVPESFDEQRRLDLAAAADFDRAIYRSFLPEIVALAKEHHIDLLLVRINEREHAEGWHEPAAAREYSQKLAAYLEANGVGFRDLRYETWMRGWHRDGGHIADDRRADYTRAFFEHVPEAFE